MTASNTINLIIFYNYYRSKDKLKTITTLHYEYNGIDFTVRIDANHTESTFGHLSQTRSVIEKIEKTVRNTVIIINYLQLDAGWVRLMIDGVHCLTTPVDNGRTQ